ncbi:hypothetical protein [Paraburkholderia youngii]|uniref:Transposase family protein n=1 Tax=Paraburkholderia youngii TaxID=2782701 RepID=A0ABX2NZL1_9BURK|nr:hypothetical protein [Paraburkholderia youngii]NVI09691.1 transposase family protein [Paraburkholderia youngii]
MPARVQRLPVLRELYREESSGKLYRVVHAENGSPEVVLCYIFGSRLVLRFISLTVFCVLSAREYAGEDGFTRLKQERDPYSVLQRSVRGTAGSDRQSTVNWQRIFPLVSDPRLFYRALRGGSGRTRILQEIADDCGVTIQRIRKLFREYLQRGMNEAAVASELWRCGRRVQPPRYQLGEDAGITVVSRQFKKRPGRKPSDERAHAARTDALERLFEQCVDIYLTSKVGPWTLEVSDEQREEIRKFAKAARFPSTRKPRCRPKGSSPPKRKRWHSPGRRGGPRTRVTWQDLTDYLNYVCRCTHEVRDGTGQIVDLELAPFGLITPRQLTNYYQTRVPPEARKRRLMGERQYLRQGRPIKGHALQHSLGPGQEYLIDATIADVYLVLSYDRTVVVGRPTVYLAMDVWSRMIVGFYVTFDPPSFEGVALMLENIATPKDEFCARFGIKIEWKDWPCEYLPKSGFFADRGNDFMKTAAWQSVNRVLGIPISNAKAGDPTLRALIERRFGIVPAYFQRATFGVVEADATTRGAPHYAWDATHTMSEFTRKLIRAVLRHNRTPIGRKGAIIEMATAGFADTPLNRWNWGLDNRTGSLWKHSLDEIRRATWPVESATPSKQGLHWRGLYFTSPHIQSKHVHMFGKHAKDAVQIQFNPNSPSQILVPGDLHWEYAQLAGSNKVTPDEGTLMEWEVVRTMDRHNARKDHQALQPQRIMDLLNNSEESRAAKRDQKEALRQSGIAHPRQARHRGSAASGQSGPAQPFGNFQQGRSRDDKRSDEEPAVDHDSRPDRDAEDSIAARMSKNIRNIIDGA